LIPYQAKNKHAFSNKKTKKTKNKKTKKQKKQKTQVVD